MKAGKVAEACDKFEAASHFTSTAGVRLNLASCWAKLGRTASAWGMYDEAHSIAERGGDTGAADLAQRAKAELEPKLSRLVIAVADANVAGLHVTRDGESVFSGAWGVGVAVDPGEHEVTAQAPGRRAWSVKAKVTGEGTSVTVTIPSLEAERPQAVSALDPAAAPAAPPPAVVSETSPAPSHAGSTQRTIGLITGAAGIVVVGVGAYFGITAASDKSGYQAHEANGRCADPTCQTDSQNAVSAGNLSTAFVAIGAAVVVGGAVVWLTAPKPHPERSAMTARIVPSVTPRLAGLSLEGSW